MIFILISALVLASYWTITEVLIPANVSYVYACEPEKFEIKYSEYSIAGQVITKESIVNEEEVKEIMVEIFEYDKGTIRHEWIHVNQIENARNYECSHKIMKRVNEVEAYIFENLPDAIFNIIYGKPKI